LEEDWDQIGFKGRRYGEDMERLWKSAYNQFVWIIG